MRLSIVVIFYDMRREASRTLRSLDTSYQRELVTSDYEVIAIDNGSSVPIDDGLISELDVACRYHHLDTESVSPVGAVNLGTELATGDAVAVIVDGARMATPGLVGQTQRAMRLVERPFVCALSWHLGPDVQRRAMLDGYDQLEEDRLLSSIQWERNGYELFSVSTLAPSSSVGFLGGVPTECSWWAMKRADFDDLGGFDEQFKSPGGGLANHDFRNRAMALPGIQPVVLLGEGVFHQIHGGVSTNATKESNPNGIFHTEYEQIRGHRYATSPTPVPTFLGQLPDNARRFLTEG